MQSMGSPIRARGKNKMTKDENKLDFNCGLTGRALSYLEIFRNEGLSEKGKDKFIGILLDISREKINVVPKKELDDTIELIHGMRDELYEKLPTGDVDAMTLIKIIKEHIKNLDEGFPTEAKK